MHTHTRSTETCVFVLCVHTHNRVYWNILDLNLGSVVVSSNINRILQCRLVIHDDISGRCRWIRAEQLLGR